jgi:hypothetical protein
VITRVRSLRRLIRANRARRRTAAALALVVAIGVVITIVLADQSPAPANGASNGSTGSGTTTVQRRDLVETDTESGTLSYAGSRTVYNRLNGTITWLPAVGQVIKPGQALYKVGNEPVILMNGTTPAYRDLKSSDSAGQDILQLNRDLVALGFNPDGIVIDNQWQAATTAGVDLFQESLGESQTGDLTLGQIVFLPGNQLISAVDATVGSGPGNSSGTPTADTLTSAPAAEFVSLKKTTTTPSAPGGPTGPSGSTGPSGPTGPQNSGGSSNAQLQALIALLRSEIAELRAAQAGSHNPGHSGSPSSGSNSPSSGSNSPSSGSNSPSSGNSGNNGGGTATALLQTSSTQLVATVNLDASKQSEAKVGEKVTVQMPAGNTVNGRITAVSPVAQSSSNNGNGNNGNGNNGNGNNGNGNSGSSTIPVTITLSGHQTGAGLDQAAVSVNFAQAKANNVLSVPVTALLAVAGGGYAVQEAAAPHSLIPVTTGLFAAGYVEISGSGIYPGLAVTNSQG